MLGVLCSLPPLDFFFAVAFWFSSAFLATSNALLSLASSARAFFSCKAISLESFGFSKVASLDEDEVSDEDEVLGLLFLVVDAPPKVTFFGLVDLVETLD